MEQKQIIKVFLDDDPAPFAEFESPVKFVLDTTKIPDGKHQLKIVAKSTSDVEGVRIIPFVVRNGPSIDVVGLKNNEVINEQTAITINTYGSDKVDYFKVIGSETPKGIPTWVWVLVILFVAFAIFYLIMYLTPDFYKSFV